MGKSSSPHPASSPSPPVTSSGERKTHTRREPPPPPPPHARPASATKTRTRHTGDDSLLDSILGGRPLSEIPPADLAALIGRLSKHDPSLDRLAQSKHYYQLQLLLTKLPADALVEIADAIASDPVLKRQGGFSNLLTFLAGKDPDLALHWISTHEDFADYYPTVIGAMAREDPHRAASLFQQALLDGKIFSNRLWQATSGIGNALAKRGAEPLLKFIDTLPERHQSNIAENALKSLPESERIKFLKEIQLRKEDGKLSNIRLEPLFKIFLQLDQTAAREWLTKLPEGNAKENLRLAGVLALIGNSDKEAATLLLRETLASSPGKEKEKLGSIINNIAYYDPEKITHYASLLPRGLDFTAEELKGTAINSLNYSIDALTAVASAIRDPAEQARLISNTPETVSAKGPNFHSLNSTDIEILSRKVATMGFTGEDAALVNAAIESARNPPPPPAD